MALASSAKFLKHLTLESGPGPGAPSRSDSLLTCLSRVVGGHGVVTHRRVAGVHGAAMWGPSVVGHWRSVVRLGPSGVHPCWRGPRVGTRTGSLALSLSLGGGGGGSRGGVLLLHLLPGLHLGVSELLHVERLPLGEQLLPLKLQLLGDTEETATQRVQSPDHSCRDNRRSWTAARTLSLKRKVSSCHLQVQNL